jgi:hypothetical protein
MGRFDHVYSFEVCPPLLFFEFYLICSCPFINKMNSESIVVPGLNVVTIYIESQQRDLLNEELT